MWSKHEPVVMMGVPIQEVVLLQSRNSPFQCTNKVAPEVRMVGRVFSALLMTALESLTSWLAGEFYKRNGLVGREYLKYFYFSASEIPVKVSMMPSSSLACWNALQKTMALAEK